MNRRKILLALLALLTLGATPLAADAQQAAKIARIGFLGNNPVTTPHLREAFL